MNNIKSLVANESFENLYVLIQSVEKKLTSDGKQYLDFMLQDMSGVINAKLWAASDSDVEKFNNSDVVVIGGDVTVYRKENQIRIKSIDLYTGMDVGHFLPSAPIEKNDLRETIYKYVFQIENHIINQIVSKVLDKYENDFFVYPAASKNHHEYVSGLAHHVASMLELSEFVVMKYPFVNRDLLYAGVILHDFGKIIELNGVVNTEYTTVGKLLGHITIGCNEIYKIAAENDWQDKEEVMLIQHMILSHHGKLEFGSPKLPFTVEAEVLSILDNLDARLNMMNKSLSSIEKGEFGPRVFSLENRKFYKHTFEE